MSSSMGELVVAMRRNMSKLDKLTAKPSALASLGFLMKQVIAMLCEEIYRTNCYNCSS
jgi:hypothetical protein